jgi:O-glycosyl hydrolase
VWSAEDLATVVALLGEQLEAEGLGDVLIFGPETMSSHNWSPDLANELYIKKLKANPDAWKHFDVWATHGYTDGFTTDKSKDSTAIYWNLIKDTGKPFWITEGGTGGHDWPAALHEMGAMVHNALVGGNASAFVPWQISEQRESEHGLMVMDQFTGKTRAAQHYFKYVRPGAVRVDATPSDEPVATSAYLHEADGTLTIVLTNPAKAEQRITLDLKGDAIAGLRQMKALRTSADEQFKELSEAAVNGGKLELTLPAESMVTLHGSTTERP